MYSVMVVENEPKWRELLTTGLKANGYRVQAVQNWEEADAQLQANCRFDVIVLNLHLLAQKDYRGEKVLESVVRYCPHTPCIILSGYPELLIKKVGRYQEQVYELLTKGKDPQGFDFDFNLLYDTLEDAIKDRAQKAATIQEPEMKKLSQKDRKRLSEELGRLPSWKDGKEVGEKSVLRAAGLPETWIDTCTLTGTPSIDAQTIITNLESLGHLVDRPTHYALGALVEHLLDNTLHVEGKAFLAYLVAHYKMVTDDLEYLDDLAQQYALLEMPASDGLTDLGWKTKQPRLSWRGPKSPDQLEAIWSKRAPFLDAVFLESGAQVARAVCRVESADSSPLGTGFLIGPDLLLTNHHVVPTDDEAEATQVRFGYRVDPSGKLMKGETFQVKHALRRSPVEELDYVVLQLEDSPGANPEIGYLKPVGRKLKKDGPLYIIQHPLGEPQKLVLQDNWITYVASDHSRVQYLTNTQCGSSGSPACNERWEVVALHHSGGPIPASPKIKHLRGNEGVPMEAILPKIRDLLP